MTRPDAPELRTLLDGAADLWLVVGEPDPNSAGVEASPGSLYHSRQGSRWYMRGPREATLRWRPLALRAATDVRDFGARGDGGGDDAPAIARALEAGAGGVIHFPPGVYRIAPKETLRVRDGTTLLFDGGAGLLLGRDIALEDGAYVLTASRVRDVTFAGVRIEREAGLGGPLVRGIVAYDVDGLRVTGLRATGLTGSSLVVSDCRDVRIEDFRIERCGSGGRGRPEAGLSVLSDSVRDWRREGRAVVGPGRVVGSGLDGLIVSATGTVVRDVVASHNGQAAPREIGAAGIYFSGAADDLLLENCVAAANVASGIDTGPNRRPISGVRIVGCEVRDNGAAGIQLDDVVDVLVESCTCAANGRAGLHGQRGGIVLATGGRVAGAMLSRNRLEAEGVQHIGIQLGVRGTATIDALEVVDNAFGAHREAPVAGLWFDRVTSGEAESHVGFRGNRGLKLRAVAARDGTLGVLADVLEVGRGPDAVRLPDGTFAGQEVLLLAGPSGLGVTSEGGNIRTRTPRVALGPAEGLILRFDGAQWREAGRLAT